MTNALLRSRLLALLLSGVCLASVFAATSCSGNESKAKKAIEEYLKAQRIKSMTMDFFYTDPNFRGKAYAGITIIHNFADRSGQPQREPLGFILSQEGEGWRIENVARYTTEKEKAALYLGGGK